MKPIFDEVRDSANRAKYQIYFLLFASEQSSSGVFPISLILHAKVFGTVMLFLKEKEYLCTNIN